MRHRLGQRRPDSPLKALPRPLALALAACFGTSALALPVGPQVVAGSAAITQAGNALTVANSPGAILHWQTFNIGANERVRFEQASASSAVLNRVLANDPSVILGQLSSNGRVWLVNPAGILVGPGARIDTAAFVASTLNITNADFLANKLKFDGLNSAGTVVNQGSITTPLGGSVYLIGSQVSNEGLITTPQGETILAAGQKVELIDTATPGVKVEISGQEGNVTNLGQITAEAGRIGIAGALIRNAGTLNASSVESEGGRIFLRATRKIELAETSKVGADGTAGGHVTAIVSENGKISGELTAKGGISAQGKGAQGSGGFVETSANWADINGVSVNTRGGTWLLDPDNVEINATQTVAGATLVTPTTIQNALSNNSFKVQTIADGTGGNGDIFVNSTVAWSANKLTLSAHRNIAINAILNGSGTASLALEYGQNAVTASNTATYTVNAPVNLPAGNNFSTKLGSDGTATAYTVVTSLSGLQNISTGLSGSYALGGNISGSAFTSVGTKTTPFTGAFAGLGHTISALGISQNDGYAGLFGATGTTAIIRDVTLDGTVISAGNYIGDLVGFNAGTISNAHTRGSTSRSGTNYIGGLVGFNTGTIDYSSNTSTNPVSAGGKSFVGGLVGANYGDIRNSYNSGSVSAGGATSGGGIAGINAGKISHSYSAGSVTNSGGGKIGGMVGINNGTIEHSYWDTQTSTQTACAGADAPSSGCTGKATADMQKRDTYSDWNFDTIWAISNGQYPTLSLRQTAPAAVLSTSDVNLWTGGGGDNNSWMMASNWSLNHVPTSSENVYVPSSVAFTFGAGDINDINLKSLICDSSFTLDGRSLTLGNSSTLSAITLNASSARLVLNGVTSIGSLVLSSGEISGTGSLNVTSGFSKTGGTIANTLTGLHITQASGNLAPGALTINGPISLVASNGALNLDSLTGSTLSAQAGNGNLVLNSGARLSATATSGNSIVLNAGSANFVNSSGSTSPFTLAGTARSLVYTGNSANASLGGLTDKPIYGKTYASYAPASVTQAGNRILYADTPVTYAVTAENKTRYYGDANPNLTYGAISLLAGDTISGSPLLATDATLLSNADTYNITASQGTLVSDYNLPFTFNTGTLTVAPRPLTVSVGGSKEYNRSAVLPAPTFTLGNLANNDSLTVSGNASFADWNVGTGKTLTASNIQVSGAKAGNYSWSTTASGTGNITARPLAIAADAKSMTYGDTVPGLSYALTTGSLITGDTLSGALTTTGSASSDVGSYPITQGSLTAGNNYSIAFSGNTLAISQRPLSLTLAGSKEYNRSAVLPAPTFTLGNLANNDSLTVSGNASFADWNVGTGKTLTASNIQISGAKAGNYSWSTTATGSGSISQRPTVTWTGAAGDGKWSTAGNWADNALPDYDPASALDNVGRILLSSGGTPLRITDSQAVRLRQTSLEVSGAGLDLDVTGGIFTGSGKFVASAGSLKLTAHSPIEIGSGGLEASQGISLLATTPEGASTILIDGPLTSTSGPITLSAYNNITLNADLTATAITRSSQIGSIQVAAGVAVREVPAANTPSPSEQVAQVVATNLATATNAATVTTAESSGPGTAAMDSSSSASRLNAPPIPSLLANLTQTIGGGEGQFAGIESHMNANTADSQAADSSENGKKPAAAAGKTTQANAKPASKTAYKKVAQCS